MILFQCVRYKSILSFFPVCVFESNPYRYIILLDPPFLFYLSFHSILVGTYIRLFILFCSILPFLLFWSQYSFYTCRYLDTPIYILLSVSVGNTHSSFFPFPILLFFSSSFHSILVGTYIYLFILSDIPKYLTPHVLSDWGGWGVVCWSVSGWCSMFGAGVMLLCFGVIVRYSTVFHPNPSRIGVWAGGWLFVFWGFDIRCYIVYYFYTYTIIISYTIIILYITIIILYITIILYIYYTLLLSSSPLPFLYILYHLFCSSLLHHAHPNIHSILVGTYIYLFIFYLLFLSSSDLSSIPPRQDIHL